MDSSLNSGITMGTRLNCAVTRDPRLREGQASWLIYPHWPASMAGTAPGCCALFMVPRQVLRPATIPAILARCTAYRNRLPLLHDLPPRFISIMVENHDGSGPPG